MAQTSFETLMILLAGMGLTQLPKTLKGLQRGVGAPPALPEDPAAGMPQLANPELMPFLLQMLGGANGQPAAGPTPAPAPAPAVPRWPPTRARPLIPRVANMDSQLGLCR